jgi:hypothetical protein
MKKKNLESFIDQATENITEDRAATKSLLMGLLKYMQVGDDRHKEVGLIAAKYLETLQRSNEQLVKLAALIQKNSNADDSISEEDRQELFDLINDKSGEES